MNHLLADLKFAVRLLRQRPLFALVAALSIAVGVGVTTTIFSVFNALLLKSPPGVQQPERIVELGRTDRRGGFDTFSWPEVMAMQGQSKQLSAIAAWRMSPMSFSAGRESERVMGMAASAQYFEVFGLKPALGRFYGPSEDRLAGSNYVVVLSHRFWTNRLAADPAIVGRTIDLNRRAFTVVGIAPEDFRGHVPAVGPDVYFPITMFGVVRPGFDGWELKQASWVTAVGRLGTGASITSANAELATIFARLWSEVDARERRGALAVTYGPIPEGGRGPITNFLSLLLALVGFILLITCANVAGMLIARAAAREKELAIRLAIGCSRAALVRQLVIESVLLFAIGGAAGVLFARWSASALTSIQLPVPIPLDLDFSADLRVLGFGLALALITGLVFGLAPALQASRPALTHALKSESSRRSSRGGRLRRGFVMAQVALSLVLLASAGLFLRSLQRAARIETGFDARNVYTLSFDLSMDGYDDARGEQFQARVLERLRAVPGVSSVAYAEDLPLDFSINEMPVAPEGWRDPAGREAMGTAFSAVGGDYFDALRIPLLRGRVFGPQDVKAAAPVAVVSRIFAERAWPGHDPIGRRVRLRGFTDESLTVIGMVADVKNQMLMETTEPMIYR
ncbi:MAG TPA: ABC transporter permease, partial [Longimicrobiales bacterium]|nr:ABC transporter permease [Longimicrobiales bacterium]